MAQDWDVTKPVDHLKISLIPEEFREAKSSTKTILQKEHVALGASNLGGQHLKGAARVYMGDAVPTTDPEGDNLDTAATSDDGRIAIVTAAATDAENLLKVYIGTAAGISTGWEGIKVAEAGTSHRVRLANAVSVRGYRATGVSTTISLIKVNASDLPEIGSGSAAIVMTSAAPSADGQVSNKKYVDDEITPISIKAWVTFDGSDADPDSTKSGLNITSITDNGTGDYTIEWGTDFASAAYAVVGTAGDSGAGGAPKNVRIRVQEAGSVRIIVSDSSHDPVDAAIINLIAIGAQ